jgi:hypothetical protein
MADKSKSKAIAEMKKDKPIYKGSNYHKAMKDWNSRWVERDGSYHKK